MFKLEFMSILFKLKNHRILKKQTVAEATILMTTTLFLGKFIAYFREVLVAKYFGATGETDAFLVALIIPTLVMGLVSNGLSNLIVPVYIEKRKKDRKKAKIFVNQIFLLWSIILLGVSLLILFFTPFFVKLTAFGFKGERLGLAVKLTRYLIPAGFATVLTGLFTGLLQARKQFLLPTLMGLIGNALIVLSLLLLRPFLGINSWTIGQLLYAISGFLVLFWVLWQKKGFFRNFLLHNINWAEIKRFFSLLSPLILISSISTLSQIIDKTIASFLQTGSIAVLNFAQKTYAIPLSLLAIPLALAIYPTFSSLALEEKKKTDYAKTLEKTLSLLWYIIIPSSFLFITLAQPIVKILFQRGAFVAQDTNRTAFTVSMYSIGLFAYAANYFLVKVFYSFKNTKTPLIITTIVVGTNIVGNIILARILGVAGIGLATSIAAIVGFLLFLSTLHKKYFKFSARRPLASQALKIILASLPPAIISLFLKPYLSAPLRFFHLAFRFALAGLLLVLLYVLLSYLLNLEGFRMIIDYLKKKLIKNKDV